MAQSNGNIFRVTGHLCGEFTGHRWILRTKASDTEFDVFFDLRLNKRLSKQSSGWWFETLLRPLWRHFNDYGNNPDNKFVIEKENGRHQRCVSIVLVEIQNKALIHRMG